MPKIFSIFFLKPLDKFKVLWEYSYRNLLEPKVMFSIFDETDIVLFDEFGIYEEVEEIYPDEHYRYYDDMYSVNGVDYY